MPVFNLWKTIRKTTIASEAGKFMSFIFSFPFNGDFEDFFAQANSWNKVYSCKVN